MTGLVGPVTACSESSGLSASAAAWELIRGTVAGAAAGDGNGWQLTYAARRGRRQNHSSQ
ncbi:MAG: hypothetical protein ACK5YC_08925 [Planctomyces sp.]